MKTILVDAIGALVLKDVGIFKEMKKLLDAYPNRKIVVTMAPDELMEKFGLNALPYEVFTSKLDPKKSEPAFYKKVLEHYDLKPYEVISFEHNPEAAESARSIGIVSYYYDETTQDLKALKDFIDTNL